MKYALLSFLCFFSISLFSAELPKPFFLPVNPYPGENASCSSCAKNSSATQEIVAAALDPEINFGGEFFQKISLAPSPFVKNGGLLTVQLGQGSGYQPGEFYTIIPPGDERGDQGYVIAREGPTKIVFKLSEQGNWGNGELISGNTPGVILLRDGMKLQVRKLKERLSYSYESPDFGATWHLTEICRLDMPELKITCIYDKQTKRLSTIILPGYISYNIIYNPDGSVKRFISENQSEYTNFEYNSSGMLTGVSSYITSAHPLYSLKQPANTKKAKDQLIRQYIAELDASGRLITLTDINGKKYSAEYMLDTNKNKQTTTNSVIVSRPDGTQSFVENTMNRKEASISVLAGKIYLPDTKNAKPIRNVTREIKLERKWYTFVPVSRIVDGQETKFNYAKDSFFAAESEMVDSDGNVTAYDFNEFGLLTAKKFSDGSSESFEYGKDGRVLKHIDRGGYNLYAQVKNPISTSDYLGLYTTITDNPYDPDKWGYTLSIVNIMAPSCKSRCNPILNKIEYCMSPNITNNSRIEVIYTTFSYRLRGTLRNCNRTYNNIQATIEHERKHVVNIELKVMSLEIDFESASCTSTMLECITSGASLAKKAQNDYNNWIALEQTHSNLESPQPSVVYLK